MLPVLQIQLYLRIATFSRLVHLFRKWQLSICECELHLYTSMGYGTLAKCKDAIHIHKSTIVIFWINYQFKAVTLLNTKFQRKTSVMPMHQSYPPLYSISKVIFKYHLPRGITVQNYPHQTSHAVFSVISLTPNRQVRLVQLKKTIDRRVNRRMKMGSYVASGWAVLN